MTTDDYADPDAVEEQARADAIRAEAGEIRKRDLGCASCAALRERAEAAEAMLEQLDVPLPGECWQCKGTGNVPGLGWDLTEDTCPRCQGIGQTRVE